MLYSTLRMCISKGTYSSGKHFIVHKSKKVKHTESEKEPVNDRGFRVAFGAGQPGFVQHHLQEGEEPHPRSWGSIARPEASANNGSKQKEALGSN